MTRRRWIALVGVGLAAVSVLAVWVGRYDTVEVRHQLAWLSPRAIELALAVALAGALSARRSLAQLVPARVLFMSLLLGGVAFAAVSLWPPKTHRIFYDEDIYQNVAQNIALEGRAQMCNEGVLAFDEYDCFGAEYNKEPNGYPFVLSLAYRVTGVREWVAHAVNRLHLAVATTFLMLVGFVYWQSRLSALSSALIFCLLPVNLLWGATAAVEPGTAAWAVVAVFAALVFVREPTWGSLSFALGASAFAAQWRPESILIFVVVFVLMLQQPRVFRSSHGFWLPVLALALLIPHFAHLWSVRGEGWGAVDGAKFAWEYVAPNARANLKYLIEARELPRLIPLLALVGIGAQWRRPALLAMPLVWFVLFFGVFLPFHAGSYRYGADIRFAVVAHASLALVCGEGVRAVFAGLSRWFSRPLAVCLPLAALLYSLSAYLPLVRAIGAEAHEARADHRAAESMVHRLPDQSVVLSHNPGMWHVFGASALQTSFVTYRPAHVDQLFRRFPGGVYFHYNFWCEAGDATQASFCTDLLATYETRVIHETSHGFKRFVLYRMLPNVSPTPAPAPAPIPR